MRRKKHHNNSGRRRGLLDHFTRRRAERRSASIATHLTFEQLEPRLQMAVVINEFLAANTNGITDQDGTRSDWIELHNNGASDVDLTGWRLTDDLANLNKWAFPATNLPAGGYLLVFASGKNRAVSGQELHANFSLDQNGESLALVMSDGTTIADAFDPFPEQLNNVSYGRGGQSTATDGLVSEFAPLKYLVPTANTVDVGVATTPWTAPAFNDASWSSGLSGIGYDVNGTGENLATYVMTDVAAQMNTATRATAYVRIPFVVSNPAELTALKLRIRYDDGFGVYLNGTRITSAGRNSPAALAFSSSATASHADAQAIVYEDIDLTASMNLLVAGNNVLAIHGLNRTSSTANIQDFLIDAQLEATRLLPPATGYMVTPTPNAANQAGTAGFVADTNFSVDRGFYSSPFFVTITTATAGAQIRYTTNGSAPTATTGLVYNPASPPLITTTTTLRAAAFKAGFTPTNVDTQTYIFLDSVIQQNGVGLPAVAPWGYAGPDWAMDPDVVNHPTYAGTIKNDLQAVPTVSLVMPWNDWFGGGGQGIYPVEAEIERAVSMEYFTADGSQEFQIDAGIEIQGGTSDDRWKMDKLSMRVKFKAPYGPEKLNADIFQGGVRDEGVATNFNTFILDAHLGYTWAYGGTVNAVDQRSRAMFIQDGYVSDLQNLAGGTAPHTRWVHLYVNGLYWGMYEMHERADEHFAESYLGGNDEDYDVIKHNATNVVSADVANPNSAIDNYAAMLALVRQDMSIPANYAAAAAKIDVDDLIAYMIVNYYVGNDDWAHQNWYASYNRVDPNGKWRYHSWDAENVLKSVTRDSTTLNNPGGPTEVFQRLILNPEFRLKFVDGVQRLMRDQGGLLTPSEAAAVYQARMQEIDRAIVGESARWGDNHTTASDPPGAGKPYLREHWIGRQDDLLINYFPQRTNNVLGQFAARGWTVPLVAPQFSKYGGTVNPGYALTLTPPPGTPLGAVIRYTLDGTDPRDAVTNLPKPSALTYSGPIIINAGTRVVARIYSDAPGSSTVNEWSPVVDQTFLLPTPFPLRITEFNYHPADHPALTDDEDLEFIELTNTSGQTINLAGVRITEFASSPVVFGNIDLPAGERIIVSRNPTAFQTVFGPGFNVLPNGYGSANLSNGGERIVLLGPLGEVLQDITYSDSAPWPADADGGGPSLEIINPLGDPSDPANWRPSLYVHGSPGASGIPGDYDGNGLVEQADFGAWRSSYGMTVGMGTRGDGNRDRLVDASDYIVWRQSMSPPASGSAVAATHAAASRSETSAAAAAIVVVNVGANVAAGQPLSAEPPRVVETRPQDDSRLRLLAIDSVWMRFSPRRPAFRPSAAPANVSAARTDDLLASLANVAAASGPEDVPTAHRDSPRSADPIDRSFVDWESLEFALDQD